MEQNSPNLFDLQIDPVAHNHLAETAKWARFLSIIGFIFCGLAAVGGLAMATVLGSLMPGGTGLMGTGVLSVIYIALAALYFFPCLYLYRFATAMRTALAVSDNLKLQEAFGNIKSCFKFMGILTIVILAFYGLAIVGGIMAAMFGR